MDKKIRCAWVGPCSLKPQLVVAFCLMSVIPVLVFLNLSFPSLFPPVSLSAIAALAVVLVFLGFGLMKRIIDSIIEINDSVKVIASGELSHTIDVRRPDEIGELGQSLNVLARHIKNNMDELKIYGERTKDINAQIDKQVLTLSGLLEIGNLITRTADLKDVFDTAIARLMLMASSSFAFLIIKKNGLFETAASSGLSAAALSGMGASLWEPFLASDRPARSDQAQGAGHFAELLKVLEARHLVLYPIVAQGGACGLVGVGHRQDSFVYTDDDVELIGLFAKQLSIAAQNDYLSRRVKELEVRDAVTDLYNRRYIMTWLDEEVLRSISHQKPCSFVVVRIQNLAQIRGRVGEVGTRDLLIKVADILRNAATPFERVGRIQDDEFGIVLSETNKRRAQDKAQGLGRQIEEAFQDRDPSQRPVLWVNVVENPIDGSDAALLFQKVHGAT